MEIFRFGFEAMASGCEVVFASGSKKEAQSIARLAIGVVSRIEHKYSRYRSGQYCFAH